MRIAPNSWSVVLVGKWNRYILTPQWVGTNLFEEDNIQVEFPVNRPELAPRYRSSDNIVFSPSIHKSQFFAQEPYNDQMLQRIAIMTRKLLTILIHTPLSSIGTNFGFEELAQNFPDLNFFNLTDSDQFAERIENVNSIEIKRQFNINGRVLNFTIISKGENVYFDFNFHYEAANPQTAAQIINDDLLILNRDLALELLNEIYNLELEEEEE